MSNRPDRVSPAEIAALLAWARTLTQASPHTDPAQRAAYLAAKTDLLARIADQHAADHPGHAEPARQVAAQASSSAAHTAALLPIPDQDTE